MLTKHDIDQEVIHFISDHMVFCYGLLYLSVATELSLTQRSVLRQAFFKPFK